MISFKKELLGILEEVVQKWIRVDELEKELVLVTDYAKVFYVKDVGVPDEIIIDSSKGMFNFIEDFEYDDGYGTQKIFGIIVFKDGTWLERLEYDGSEQWVYKKKPSIEEVFSIKG